MEANFFDTVPNFSSGGDDDMPWCDNDFVLSCQRAVAQAEKGSSDDFLQVCILLLLWALVHSRRLEDVQRGIAMLEASLAGTNSRLQKREKLYLLAVGLYRSVNYKMSRYFVDECLMIAPDWRQAQILKKTVEDRIKDIQSDDTGIGTVAAGVAMVAGWIVAALTRRN